LRRFAKKCDKTLVNIDDFEHIQDMVLQNIAILPKEKSGKEVAKQAKPSFSKLTPRYWSERVFRVEYREGAATACYYCRVQHAGRRETVSLQTGDKDEAAKKAASFYAAVRSKGWDAALAELDPERAKVKQAATVGDVIDAVMAAGLRKRTAENYCNALRWFAARALGLRAGKKDFGPTGSKQFRARLNAVPLDKISGAMAQRIVDLHVEAAGPDELLQRRARISAHSFLVNARAGTHVAAAAGVLAQGAPLPFEGVKVKGDRRPPKYRSAIDAAELLQAAKRELRENNRDAYLAVLLALGAGLRRGEIQNLTWANVNAKGQFIDVAAGGSWRPKTDASENLVYVDAGMIAELENFRGQPESTVLEKPYVGTNDAAAWLRGQGIKANKPLHTLRKEFGSLVYNATDLLVASRQLRHSATKVTESFYVEPRKQYAPEIGAMLAAPPEKKP
jgi:integrase